MRIMLLYRHVVTITYSGKLQELENKINILKLYYLHRLFKYK